MIKTLLIFCSFSLFSNTLTAQCTIDQNAFSGANDYGFEPTSAVFNGSSMATFTEMIPNEATIQIHIDPDTVTSLGAFPVMQVRIDSLVGLPAAFTYVPNPIDGIYIGSTYGCLLLSGMATVGLSDGGPNNDGIYPFRIYTTKTVEIFSVPTDFPDSIVNYQLQVINNTAGLFETNSTESFSITYNGTDVNANLFSLLQEETAAELIDMNGNKVRSFILYKGTTILETTGLQAGMYIVQAGNSRVRLMKF